MPLVSFSCVEAYGVVGCEEYRGFLAEFEANVVRAS